MLTLLAVLLLALPPARAGSTELNPTTMAVTPDVITQYDAVRVSLVNDALPATVSAARSLAALSPGDQPLASAATAVANAVDLPGARIAFGELSRLLVQRIAATTPAPKVVTYFCPMFEQGFGYWLQPKAGIANPYMGQSMPACGEEVSLKTALKAATATAR